jgi:hypothetical protein
MNKTISRERACDLIANNGGKFFSVVFTKRTTKSRRKMTCRRGVTSQLTGGGRNYNPQDHSLLTVFSIGDKGYRSVPLEGLTSLALGGETYSIVGES